MGVPTFRVLVKDTDDTEVYPEKAVVDMTKSRIDSVWRDYFQSVCWS